MICREARERLALALRRYTVGRISNDELEDVEIDWRDRGAVAVKRMAGRLYSDMKRHYATDRHAIRGELRRTICIATTSTLGPSTHSTRLKIGFWTL